MSYIFTITYNYKAGVRALVEVCILNYIGPLEVQSKSVVSGDSFDYWDDEGVQGVDFRHIWVKRHNSLSNIFLIFA